MNLLGLIFFLLSIFAMTISSTLSTTLATKKTSNAYLGSIRAHRSLFYRYQRDLYRQEEGKIKRPPRDPSSPRREQNSAPETEPASTQFSCARLNLYPLIAEGKEAHPSLYRIGAEMLSSLYGPLFSEKSAEPFLDRLLVSWGESLRAHPLLFSPEKLSFANREDRLLFYRLLKGTKDFSRKEKKGYPPLLDFFSLNVSTEKVCLLHASDDLLSFLFGSVVGEKLFSILQNDEETLSLALLERLHQEEHQKLPSSDLLALLNFSEKRHTHEKKKKISATDPDHSVIISKHFF